jgi:hypothetical protein
MKQANGELIFSASDLSTFTACPHVIHLDLKNHE